MNKHPRLEVIVGTMFSGKSEELIRRLNRYRIAGKSVQAYKPGIDDRYSACQIASHSHMQIEATPVQDVAHLREIFDPHYEVLGIDEVQFFKSDILGLLHDYVKEGGIAVVSGLFKDFRDEIFPFTDGYKDMADLLALADDLQIIKALCTYQENGHICGEDATKVQRFDADGYVVPYDDPVVKVGAQDAYAPRCRQHFKEYQEVLAKLKC